MVYKYSSKTSSDYRQATELDNYLLSLLKVENMGNRKGEVAVKGQGGRKKAPPAKTYLPLSSYKSASALEKRQLGMMIRKLNSENLQQVIYVMFESS